MATSILLLLTTLTPSTFALSEAVVAENENWTLVRDTAIVWACIVAALVLHNSLEKMFQSVRTVVNLSTTTNQRYFAVPNTALAAAKQHWLLAPLFRKRHMREFKLSAATNMGTLPSRMQTSWLLGYFLLNMATTLVRVHWHLGRSVWLSDLCNRTGTLATLNLLPLFVFAARNNPLIRMLDIRFDQFNLLHRWIGRIVVVEAFLHGAFFVAGLAVESGWASVAPALASTSDNMPLTGTIGVAALLVILLLSPSIVRHAFYETFLHTHILLVFVSIVVIWIHLEGLNQQNLLLAAMIGWGIERAYRFYLLVRNNVHRGLTKAEVEALPGDAVRITLRVARPWTYRPGQHVYLYIPSVGWWTSHPFTIAWTNDTPDWRSDKAGLPLARHDILPTKPTSLSLIVRRRTGFTDRLYTKAARIPGNKILATAFVEGPYGHRIFHSYGTVMLFAAGVGITQQVPPVRDLVRGYASGTTATRRVTLVWIVQLPEHLEWVHPWMTEILGMEKRRDVLRVMLFITRPRSGKEIVSPSASVLMFPGKPNVAALIDREQEGQVGAMAGSCCGTGSLRDDLRRAVRERCEGTVIDFSEETFSW